MAVPFPIAAFVALFVLCAFPPSTFAVVRTWDNGNGNGNWSTAANWSGDAVPDGDDIAYFGTTSAANSSIDASFVGRVSALMVAPGYTGTITLGRAFSVGTGGIILSGGTLDVSASNYQLAVSGSFINLGGTFVERTGILLLAGRERYHTLTEPQAFSTLVISDDSLVGYWKFDDANGGTAKDSSGRANNGTLTTMENGADWVTTGLPSQLRAFNQSTLDFDGSNDYVSFGSMGATAFPGTLSFWIKPDSVAGGDMRILGNTGGNCGGIIRASGTDLQTINIGCSAWSTIATGLSTSDWQHIVITFDGTNMKGFRNGVAGSSYNIGGSPNFWINQAWTTGAPYSGFGSYYDGKMDDIRVYKRVLSYSEIQNLYNGYPHTGSGIYSLGSKLNVSGSLLNYTGELRTGNAYPLTLSGNLLNLGQFTSTGTVYLRGGTNQTMSGNTVFKNLDVQSNGRNRTLFLDHSSRQSVSGALVLQGTASKTLTLRSTRTGSAANLLLDGDAGTQTIEYVNVKDNDASGGGTLYCYTASEGCTNAGNTTNWTFSQTYNITGTVYTNEGTTVIGSNKTVAVSLNGGAASTTDDTDAGGQYALTGLTMTGGTIVTLYLDDETEDAVLVTLGSGSSMTGIHLYQDRLITRSDSGSVALTNQHLNIADNNGDTDISALYLLADSNTTLQMKPAKELYVWSGDTFTPGRRVKSHDVEVKGTLAMGTNGLTVSGSLVANAGTLTTSTGVILRSFSDGIGETLSLGSNVIKDLTISDDSLVGYWKFDDGNGGTAKDSSSSGNNGTLTNMETGSDWITSSLNAQMRYFNQSALDFDESSEYLTCNANDFPTSLPATIATWVYFDADQGGSDYDYVLQASVFGGAQDMINMAREASTNKLYYVSDGTVRAGPVLTTGQWLHVALVFVSNTKVQAYVNGTVQTIDQPTSLTPEGAACYIGRFSDGSFPHYIDGKIDDLRLYKRALSASEIANLYNGYPHTGSGIYSLGSKLNVSGSLLNYTGELRTGNAYPLTLSGNLLNLGQFTSTGTVYLRGGTNQTMSGNTVFKNLDVQSNGRNRTLFLDHSSRQSVSGALVLQGTASKTLTLRSTRTGSAANLLLDGDAGTQTIEYVNVKDNDASGGGTFYCYTASEGCTNAGNTTNWTFASAGSSITGTVYTNEGTTVIGANKTVAVSLNGGAASTTDDTDAGGQYALTGLTMTGGTIVTLYLDDETEDAVLVTLGSGSSMTGMHLYQDRLITRSESGSHVMTNARLAIADNNADTDITALYVMADSNATLQVKPDKELYVWSGDTFTPGRRVKSHDVEVKGTLAMGTNGLTVSGSLVANAGTLTTSTGVIIRSFSDGIGETLSLGSNVIKDLTISDDSLVGYWKFDDGNGGTAKDSSLRGNNGTLTSMETGRDWVTGHTGSHVFFNPNALDFDGNDDYVSVGNMGSVSAYSVSLWAKRNTISGSFDVVFGGTSSYKDSFWAYEAGHIGFGDAGVASWAQWNSVWTDKNSWHHIVIVAPTMGNSQSVILYFDGQSQGTRTVNNVTGTFDALKIGEFASILGSEFFGQIDDFRVYNRALSASEIQKLYNGYPHTGSGVYSLGSKLNVSGSLLNYTGELRTGNAYPITASGNWLNMGQFTSTGTVYLRGGTNQTMSGNTVFGNLNATSNGRNRTIFMDHSSRQSASGALVLQGTVSNALTLRSTRTGSGANLLLDGSSGSQEIAYMNVRNNDASGGSTLVCYAIAEGCTDSGNTTNWLFLDPSGRNQFFFLGF